MTTAQPSAPLTPNTVFLQVHVTVACNLACRHCYQDAGTAQLAAQDCAEALKQLLTWQDEVGAPRAALQITGGEPLLHPEIWEILALASARVPTALLSNGTLITAEVARRLAALGVAVQLSVDGLEETHDAWRGPGTFQQALAGLRHLQDAGVTRAARMTVAQENIRDVIPLLEFLTPMIDQFHVSRIIPIGSCRITAPAVEDYRQVIYALYAAAATRSCIGLHDPFFGVLLRVDRPQLRYHGCSAGISGLCLTETGVILPCRRLPVPLGTWLRATTLSKVYQQHPVMQDLRQRALQGSCGACEDRDVCGGSRCAAFAETGDPLAADPGCIYT